MWNRAPLAALRARCAQWTAPLAAWAAALAGLAALWRCVAHVRTGAGLRGRSLHFQQSGGSNGPRAGAAEEGRDVPARRSRYSSRSQWRKKKPKRSTDWRGVLPETDHDLHTEQTPQTREEPLAHSRQARWPVCFCAYSLYCVPIHVIHTASAAYRTKESSRRALYTLCKEWINHIWKTLAHSGLAAIVDPQRAAPTGASVLHITLLLSSTNGVTVKLHRQMACRLLADDVAQNTLRQRELAQGVIWNRLG